MADFPSEQAPRAPAGGPEFTGRHLLLCRENDTSVLTALRDKAGLTLASASDFTGAAVDMGRLGGADGVYFEKLGVAVTSSMPDQLTSASETSGIIATERERVVYICGAAPDGHQSPMSLPPRGAAVGISAHGLDDLICTMGPAAVARLLAELDESARTWGLASTRVTESSRTGRGVRVAILDTGIDLAHPDFAGRAVVSQSFIEGEPAQDKQTHGTHTAGTAVGAARPATMPRYGVACEAEVYVGKVLADSGRGTDGTVIAGINWALTNRCRVISMSLGSPTMAGETYSQVYETAAQRALAANALLVAAAGNESRRPDLINLVGRPASCPSVMAVGAVDADMQIAYFSTRSADRDAGKIDIVGPGVDVYSTTPMPTRYGRKDGTSMATPHVSGIAAMYLEAKPNVSARDLWKVLIDNAKRLDLPVEDAGAGLVQAPR